MYLIDLEIFPSTYVLSQLVDKYLIHIGMRLFRTWRAGIQRRASTGVKVTKGEIV